MQMMKAAYLLKIREIRFENIRIPEPKDDEALVRIKSVGVCGSDVHYYTHGRIGSFVVNKPLILGHESAGEVVQIGRAVKGVKIGDRVALEPGIPCRKCSHCRTGEYNLCKDIIFFATPPADGTFCEYVTHPVDYLFPLPDTMTYDEGALIEPLSVGLHACRLADLRPGHSVAILGAGPIGLVTLQVARAMGASTIIISDVVQKRRDLAKTLGAQYVLDPREMDVVHTTLDLTDGLGTDVVFEAAGSQPTTQATVKIVRRGGHIVWTGMAPEGEFAIPVSEVIAKEIRISGQFRYANTYPVAIRFVSERRVDLSSMITHAFAFHEIATALERCAAREPEIIKAVVRL